VLNDCCGRIATGRNATDLFMDPKTHELFGEMRFGWR